MTATAVAETTVAQRHADAVTTLRAFVAGARVAQSECKEAVALALEQRGNLVRFVAEPREIVSIMVT